MPEEPIPSYTIKDVWAHNAEEEFRAIRKLIIKYPYVAMVSFILSIFLNDFFVFCFKDTEFPGIVVRPLGEFKTTAEYQYQCLKLNVDFLKIIQLGLTFMDSQGKSPPGVCSYQFNFNFNLT